MPDETGKNTGGHTFNTSPMLTVREIALKPLPEKASYSNQP